MKKDKVHGAEPEAEPEAGDAANGTPVLVAAPREALRKARSGCGAGLVAVQTARRTEVGLEVFEDIADRVRTAANHGATGFYFPAGSSSRVDPFAADPHVQSATFLAMAAALECGAPVRFITEGLPARGYAPLFARYPDLVRGQVRFIGSEGDGVLACEPNAASVGARLGLLAGGRIAPSTASGPGSGGVSRAVSLLPRLDPVIPGLNDDGEKLGGLLDQLAAAGARSLVAVPLRFSAAAREQLSARVGREAVEMISRHYLPGRARRRVGPVLPGEWLPIEREASLTWRLRMACEERGLALVVCGCGSAARGAAAGSAARAQSRCGLWPAGPGRSRVLRDADEAQMALWAV